MLSHELRGRLQACHGCAAIASGSATLSYGELLSKAETLAARLEGLRSARTGVYFRNGAELIAALIALEALGTETYLIGAEWPVEKAISLVDSFGVQKILTDFAEGDDRFVDLRAFKAGSDAPHPAGESKVVIFTSGTTGEPKGAVHTWRSLAAGIKVDPKFEGSRWLLTFGLSRFAGLQVFLHSFLNGGCLVIPESNEVAEVAELVEKHQIENVSGTPTFWRKFLTGIPAGVLEKLPLKQITLGGEIAGQTILTALKSTFPQAQVTHIYASTEAGVCFSVRDGIEGFPAEYLQPATDRVGLKVENGELHIRSSRAMRGYVGSAQPGEWLASGDLVEVRGDRVYFLGRKTEIINVGGSKVYPAEVEDEIRKIPGVRNVRVSGQRSSFAGQLVRAEIVSDENKNHDVLKAAIIKRCSETLEPYKRPRLIEFVAALEENESGKVVRK